jgi:phosphoenolpyruvate synthase/pyruvate phosphate dikinase
LSYFFAISQIYNLCAYKIRHIKGRHSNDIAKVGGKNASLGEMYTQLNKKGINIPNGFATTSKAFNLFLQENNLEDALRRTELKSK